MGPMRKRTQGVFTVVMKNCDPLVLGPAFAMESRPGVVCLRLKFSSGSLSGFNQKKKKNNRKTETIHKIHGEGVPLNLSP